MKRSSDRQHTAHRNRLRFLSGLMGICAAASSVTFADTNIGEEVAVPRHLQDGEEYTIPMSALVDHGKQLFTALWTVQDGAGRPLTKGNGNPLTDPTSPLVFPRNQNRISAPDSNGCVSCHNRPFVGGGGDSSGIAVGRPKRLVGGPRRSQRFFHQPFLRHRRRCRQGGRR